MGGNSILLNCNEIYDSMYFKLLRMLIWSIYFNSYWIVFALFIYKDKIILRKLIPWASSYHLQTVLCPMTAEAERANLFPENCANNTHRIYWNYLTSQHYLHCHQIRLVYHRYGFCYSFKNFNLFARQKKKKRNSLILVSKKYLGLF